MENLQMLMTAICVIILVVVIVILTKVDKKKSSGNKSSLVGDSDCTESCTAMREQCVAFAKEVCAKDYPNGGELNTLCNHATGATCIAQHLARKYCNPL